jgi:hypothetical protein
MDQSDVPRGHGHCRSEGYKMLTIKAKLAHRRDDRRL